MFKYTKRLISDIRFWHAEYKLRRKEDAELDRVEDDAMNENRPPMAGFVFYQEKQRDRKERMRLHKEQREALK